MHNKTVELIGVLVLLLSLAAAGQAPESAGYLRKEYSIIKPLAGPGSLQAWDLMGSAIATNDHIRLTPDQRSSQGAIWNELPSFTRDWEVHLQFRVHGVGTNLFGDGFAFWYTRDRAQLGGVFGGVDKFSGLGLFFDTYANQNGEHTHEHPYISTQINNGSISYDHDRDGTHSEVGGCSAAFRGVDSDTYAAIRYLGKEKRLTVQYDIDGQNEWKECFDISGVSLPMGYYFGLSAATGDLSDNHDIISMKFYDLDPTDSELSEDQIEEMRKITPSADSAEVEREHVDDEPGSFSTKTQKLFWFLYAFAFLAVVGGIAGFLYYQKCQEDSKKRFY